jgi:hypothetical protein
MGGRCPCSGEAGIVSVPAKGRFPPAVGPKDLRRSALAGLVQQFPGVLCWYGEATCKWWGMVRGPGGTRLVEALHPEGLRREIVIALIGRSA